MAIPINKAAGPDNPNPAVHLMSLMHDVPISERAVVRHVLFGHGQPRRLPHPRRRAQPRRLPGQLYNGKPVALLTSRGSEWGSIAAYATGIVGRGVLLDAARHRGVDWLEPGEAVTRAELEAIERRRVSGWARATSWSSAPATTSGAWRWAWSNDYPPAGEGKAGLHVDTVPWMHERQIAAFLPDGDGETVPSNVEGMPYPIHVLQLDGHGHVHLRQPAARGAGGGLRAGGRWEFMVTGLPLRLPGPRARPGTRSPSSGRRSGTREDAMERRFVGKVALVTGATTGIGQATAVRLAAEGALVGVNQLPTADPGETLRRVKEAGGEAFPVVADMRDPAAVTAMVQEVARRGGRLDYVVSNAAINPFMPWDATSIEAFDELFETNVRGTWVVCTEAAKQMIAEGHGGAIVMVSSISAHVGAPTQVAYCGTKGAISMLGKALGSVLGRTASASTSWSPGPSRPR